MEKISALIPTHNNEDTIRRCLESVKWVDEIVVIDSLSTDRTVEICQAYTQVVIHQPFLGYARQKNLAIATCQSEWILQLDSDEELEPGLQEEICQILGSPDPAISAYQMARKNHVLGQWLRVSGLYPDYQTRLFRKSAGRFVEREVHERLTVSGPVPALKHHILHYGMPRISKQLHNLDSYTGYEAQELHKKGAKFHSYQLLLRPVGVFLYRYLWQLGILAGYRGFVLAVYLAGYSFLTYAKLWELEVLEDSPSDTRPH